MEGVRKGGATRSIYQFGRSTGYLRLQPTILFRFYCHKLEGCNVTPMCTAYYTALFCID